MSTEGKELPTPAPPKEELAVPHQDGKMGTK